MYRGHIFQLLFCILYYRQLIYCVRGVAWWSHSITKRVLNVSTSRCHSSPDGWPCRFLLTNPCHTYTHPFRPNCTPLPLEKQLMTIITGFKTDKIKSNDIIFYDMTWLFGSTVSYRYTEFISYFRTITLHADIR